MQKEKIGKKSYQDSCCNTVSLNNRCCSRRSPFQTQHSQRHSFPDGFQIQASRPNLACRSSSQAEDKTLRWSQVKHNLINEGDLVLLKNLRRNNKLQPHFETSPFTVVKVYERSAKLCCSKGKEYVRSKAHMKLFHRTIYLSIF